MGCPIGSAKDCRGQMDDGLTIDNRRNWRGGGLEGTAEGRLCRRVEVEQGADTRLASGAKERDYGQASRFVELSDDGDSSKQKRYGTGARTKASAETGCADCVRVSFGSGSVQ